MAALTTYSKDLLLKWLLTTETATRPTAWYVALHTADPTVAGNVAEVVVGTDADYARQTVTFGTPAAGQDLNGLAVSWTAASNATTHTVTHATIWDSLTTGNCLLRGTLSVSRERVANGVLTISVGEIVAAAS